jgi:cytochrome c-type biogenesis protein CcmH/NrfF
MLHNNLKHFNLLGWLLPLAAVLLGALGLEFEAAKKEAMLFCFIWPTF